ncbi:MAG: hypothetical protein ACLSFT_05085 [Ruminococcus callidus]
MHDFVAVLVMLMISLISAGIILRPYVLHAGQEENNRVQAKFMQNCDHFVQGHSEEAQ